MSIRQQSRAAVVDSSPTRASHLRRDRFLELSPAARGRPERRSAPRVIAAMLVGAVTGWLIGAVLAGLAAWTLPRVLGPDREHAALVARFEAIGTCAQMLRDTLSAATGLEQTIMITALLMPDAIHDPVVGAADRLAAGDRLALVLRALSGELADPTADLIISALVLAVERCARNLGELHGSRSIRPTG
jgi:tight adherence protein B